MLTFDHSPQLATGLSNVLLRRATPSAGFIQIPLYKQQSRTVVSSVESRSFFHSKQNLKKKQIHEISNIMHPNAILAFFTLLALPLWALPLENDQVIVARELDHIELPRDVMYEVLDERGFPIGALFRGARKLIPHHKWVPFFCLSDCLPCLI
jgi:hypothetical protein